MRVENDLFYIIPLIASLCNAFLLLTFLSMKKNRLVLSFLGLLVALTLWPLGSLLMRLNIYPGVAFWYQVSMISIMWIPTLIYIFVQNYSNQSGRFLQRLWILGTAVLSVLNVAHVFVSDPQVTVQENGQALFSYTVRWPAFLLLIFAAAVLISAGQVIYKSVKKDGLPSNSFRPLLLGVLIMFLAMLLDLIPSLVAVFPVDPFACMLNAILVYYMLYQKRLFTLSQFASSGSTYLVSTVITALVLFTSYQYISDFYDAKFDAFTDVKPVVMAVFVSVTTLLFFLLLKKLAGNLFVKDQQRRELTLKDFSAVINRTLNQQEIINAFAELINEHTSIHVAYIFTRSKDSTTFQMLASTDAMRSTAVAFEEGCAFIQWLQTHRTSIDYPSFQRTVSYKGMWEREKRRLAQLNVDYILPVLSDNTLSGFVLLTKKQNKKSYSYQEISFMESVITVLAVSLKNAELYETIREEAHRDSLTNVYNRRRFTELFEERFQQHKRDAVTLVLISFDDFKLYNELYGSTEGDLILRRFADILKTVIGTRGFIGRYSGKEFALCLPVCSSERASDLVDEIRQRFKAMQDADTESMKRFLTFSVGICTNPTVATSAHELLTFMNMAIYIAKNSGKNRTIVYTRESERAGGGAEPLTSTKMADIAKQYASTIYALTAAIDAKDHYTFSHSINVSRLATQLARCAGLNDEYVEIIRQAGLLHDIGKIGVPEAILSKNGRLDEEEYSAMKKHVENAIAIVRHLPSLDYVIPVAIAHHERYDGHGYPRGLSGENIPLGGRCLAIADSFDAIVSERPYKPKRDVEYALSEIAHNLGTQFDPALGKTFVEGVRSGAIQVN